MEKIIIMMMFCFFIFQNVYAGNLNFETTAEGITKALTKADDKQKIKTRSLQEFSTTKTRSIKVVGKEQGKIVEKTITISENQPNQGVNLKIEFDVDSYNIRPDSYSLLDELGRALTNDKLKEKSIVIKGHTDSDADDTYNLRLSLSRGIAVKSYLTSNFPISSGHLKVIGYGEGAPLVPNTNKSNKQLNRRVEIATTQ